MADLVVDYDLLTELERSLTFADQEFKNLTGDIIDAFVRGIDVTFGDGAP